MSTEAGELHRSFLTRVAKRATQRLGTQITLDWLSIDGLDAHGLKIEKNTQAVWTRLFIDVGHAVDDSGEEYPFGLQLPAQRNNRPRDGIRVRVFGGPGTGKSTFIYSKLLAQLLHHDFTATVISIKEDENTWNRLRDELVSLEQAGSKTVVQASDRPPRAMPDIREPLGRPGTQSVGPIPFLPWVAGPPEHQAASFFDALRAASTVCGLEIRPSRIRAVSSVFASNDPRKVRDRLRAIDLSLASEFLALDVVDWEADHGFEAAIGKSVIIDYRSLPGEDLRTFAAAFTLELLALASRKRRGHGIKQGHVVVCDEAHRFARLRSLDLMMREGRSLGVSVVLASQAPGDFDVLLPAETTVCFRLIDLSQARGAATVFEAGHEVELERLTNTILSLRDDWALIGSEGGRLCRVRLKEPRPSRRSES